MKLAVIAILMVSLLFVFGCDDQGAPVQTGSVFIGGTDGLTAAFEPFGLQEENVYVIYDSEDFPMEIILKNEGEENIPIGKATLRLLGPPTEDFTNIPSWTLSNTADIEKISEFNPEGGEEIIVFTPTDYALYNKDVVGFTDVNWNLEYIYDYKTHLVINDVCFKGDITDDKVCEIKEPKQFSVSGAPITVTSVEQDTGGKGIMLLKINVQNAGTGDSTIPEKEFDTRFSQIAFSIDEADKWECKSGGRVGEARLVDNMAQIICRLNTPLGEDELYTKSVTFTLDYLYKELVQEKLRIKESVS